MGFRIRIVLAVVLAGIAMAPLLASRPLLSSVRDMWPSTPEIDASLSKGVARIEAANDLYRARMDQLIGGTVIEPSSAGFHLVKQDPPPVNGDPFDQGTVGSLRGDLELTGFYPFLDIYSSAQPDGSQPSVFAAWSRLFTNSIISTCQVTGDQNHTGKFLVQISFNSTGIQTLAALLETQPGCTWVTGSAPIGDWAGYGRNPGDPLTEMRAVLIRDNKAYASWSVSAYVRANQPGQPIVIADNLDSQPANDIRIALGF